MNIPRSKRFATGLLAGLVALAWTPFVSAQSYTKPSAPATPSYNNGASDSASRAYGGCTIPSQRDASCLGWSGADGTKNTDNAVLSRDPRGANARRVPGVTVPPQSTPNSCVSMPVTLWSYLGTTPSFITPAGGGYLGSGGAGGPTVPCTSPTDGSCANWVPSAYRFLFLGGSSFVECGGNPAMGSVSCPATGSNAMVTNNLSAAPLGASGPTQLQPYIVACRTGIADASATVNAIPFAFWNNCASSGPSCSYMVYDTSPNSETPTF